MSTKLRQPVWPPRERGTARAFGLAVALHVLLAAIVLSSARVSQRPPAGRNAVIAVRGAPVPMATPIPHTGNPDLGVTRSALSNGLVAANKQVPVVRHHRSITIKSRRLQVPALRIVRAVPAPRAPLPQATTVASQAAGGVERDHAARLAALQAIAGGPLLESRTMPSPGYAEKVARRVRTNVVAPFAIHGNPSAVVALKCAPSGALISVTMQRSSGNPQWDRAVLAAVEKSDPMPRDVDGTTPSRIVLTFQPKG